MAYQKIGFKNGNVLTAEQLIHMEDGIINAEKKAASGGGTGTGLPSDVGAYKYMATDGEGKWVAEDRLGYKSVEEVVVLPVQQFDLSSNGGGQYVAMLDIDGLTEGKEYSVEFDGTEYATIAKKASMYDMDVVYIGSSLEESGGLTWDVPFCVMYVAEQGAVTLTTQKASVSFGLSEITETTHPIPAEYLPNMPFCINITPAPPEYDYIQYVADKSYNEVMEAETQKRPIVGTFTHTNGLVYTLVGCDGAAAGCYFAAFDVSAWPTLFKLELTDHDKNRVNVYEFELNATEVTE